MEYPKYTRGFWAGMTLGVIGLLIIFLGPKIQVDPDGLAGSICSIAGFMWGILEKVISPIARMLNTLHQDHVAITNMLNTLH